jgi:hypothetical protein
MGIDGLILACGTETGPLSGFARAEIDSADDLTGPDRSKIQHQFDLGALSA